MTAEANAAVQAVGIDVGGTKTAAALVGGDGTVLALETLPTPADDMDATLATVVKAARAVMTPEVTGVGIHPFGRWGDKTAGSVSRRQGWSIGGPASSCSPRTSRGARCPSPPI